MDYQKSTTTFAHLTAQLIRYISVPIVIAVLLGTPVFADTTQTRSVSITAIVPAPSSGGGSSSGGSSGGGGGGGGSSSGSISIDDTGVMFRGVAYPGSLVALLQNGRLVAEQPASPDASFSLALYGIRPGTYTFSIRGKDTEGRQSSLNTYTLSVSSGVTTVVRGIFLAPTVSIDKTEVRRGDVLTVLGRTTPDAQVTVVFNSETQLIKRAVVDRSGNWVYRLNTLELEYGNHETKAQAESEIEISPFSQVLGFKVGDRTVAVQTPTTNRAFFDLSKDGRINLIDFSMLVYWYKRPNPPVNYDFNKDNQITLADLSILIYNWTG